MDYQGSLQRTGQTRVATVPTALQWACDFSELGNRIFDPLTSAAFPGNRIPVSRFNNISQQVASFYPAPTGPGVANNFVENVTQPSNQQSFDVKSDFQLAAEGRQYLVPRIGPH
jgi:hypothetical protein